MTPTVSVIVPTRNRGRRLPELLDALSSERVEDIVMVVNGSQDDSLQILEGRARSDARLKPFAIEGASQSRALQLAAERATGEVLLMLDDDVIPEPGLVAGHARHHADAGDRIVLGYMPVVLPARRRPDEYPLYLYSRAYENTCAEYERDPSTILRGYWAGNVSLRRETALRVGLDPSAELPGPYTNHRDRDFGLRCEAAGLRAVFDRNLRAAHNYKRPPAGFARSARGSGYNRWVIHQVHADKIGHLAEDSHERAVRFPGNLLVRWARRPLARGPIQFILRRLATVAGFAHMFRLETHAGHLIGTIERQRGAMEAAAAVGPTLAGDAIANPSGQQGKLRTRRLSRMLGLSQSEAELLVSRAQARLGRPGCRIRIIAFTVATAPVIGRVIPPPARQRLIAPLVYAVMAGPAENNLYARASPTPGDKSD